MDRNARVKALYATEWSRENDEDGYGHFHFGPWLAAIRVVPGDGSAPQCEWTIVRPFHAPLSGREWVQDEAQDAAFLTLVRLVQAEEPPQSEAEDEAQIERIMGAS